MRTFNPCPDYATATTRWNPQTRAWETWNPAVQTWEVIGEDQAPRWDRKDRPRCPYCAKHLPNMAARMWHLRRMALAILKLVAGPTTVVFAALLGWATGGLFLAALNLAAAVAYIKAPSPRTTPELVFSVSVGLAVIWVVLNPLNTPGLALAAGWCVMALLDHATAARHNRRGTVKEAAGGL